MAGNVQAVLSGSVNLAATQGFVGTAGNLNNFFTANGGNLAFGGGVSSDVYDTNGGWTPFGTTGFSLWDSSIGDRVALFSDPAIGVPLGYVSGSALSATATEFGASFASLGFTLGSFVTVFTNNQITDTVTVNIIRTPEPSTLALIVLGLAGLGYARKRKA